MYAWPDARRRDFFPVDTAIPRILDLLRSHQLVVITAPTGTGKTTRLPQGLALAGYNTVVTQNRRPLVRWNAERVASEMGSAIGDVVGFSLFREERRISAKTKVRFVIDESLLNEIRINGGKLPEGVVVIDEAHTRSLHSDLLLGAIKMALPSSPKTRIIIMSATLNPKIFLDFFGQGAHIDIPGLMKPVRRSVEILDKNEHHAQGATRVALRTMGQFLRSEIVLPDGIRPTQGTMLVILPGKEDIRKAADTLQRQAILAGKHNFEIFELHSESSPETLKAITAPLKPNVLRIVVATEIVRHGATLRDVIVVIDCGQKKREMTNANGVAVIVKVPISKGEADQAAGRTGRTCAGIYVYMGVEGEYESLAPLPEPEILYAPLESTVLQIAALGQSVRTFPLIDRPETARIDVAIRRLQRMKALDESEKILEMGTKLLKLTVPPSIGFSLYFSSNRGNLLNAVALFSLFSAERIFLAYRQDQIDREDFTVTPEVLEQLLAQHSINGKSRPSWIRPYGENFLIAFDNRRPATMTRATAAAIQRRLFWNGENDFAAMLCAFFSFLSAKRSINNRSDLAEWCAARFLSLPGLETASIRVSQLIEDLRLAGITVSGNFSWPTDTDAADLVTTYVAGHPEYVAMRNGTQQSLRSMVDSFYMQGQSTITTKTRLVVHGPIRKVPVDRRNSELKNFVEIAAEVSVEELEKSFSDIISRKPVGEPSYSLNLDQVQQDYEVFLGTLPVGRETVHVLDRAVARPVFINWLLSATGDEPGLPRHVANSLRYNRSEDAWIASVNNRAGRKVYGPVTAAYYDHLDVCNLRELGERRIWYQYKREAAEKILVDFPDEIEVAGMKLKVDYLPQTKRIKVVFPEVEYCTLPQLRFLELFSREQVKLPNGEVLEVDCKVGKSAVAGAKPAKFAQAFGGKLPEAFWRFETKPELPSFEATAETRDFPVLEHHFGPNNRYTAFAVIEITVHEQGRIRTLRTAWKWVLLRQLADPIIMASRSAVKKYRESYY